MEKEIFKQFENQFGKDWLCNCGSSFRSEWVEIVSQGQNSILGRYLCQVCGREQVFAVSEDYDQIDDLESSAEINLPSSALTADDVLDIRQEVATISTGQIKGLNRRSGVDNTLSSKIRSKKH